MKKLLLFTFLFTTLILPLHAQQQDPYEYSSEFIWGVNKNTAGGWIGGVVAKYAVKMDDRMLQSFGLELMNVKHPKEYRFNSNGGYFIYGKINYLYAVRLQYGRELILFKKDDEQGVEIKAIAAVGPSIGVVNPYYVNIAQSGNNLFYTKSVRHDPAKQPFESIFGPGRIFQGLGEASITPGINGKIGLSFEMGSLKSHVTGFELGFLLDKYVKDIPLMAGTTNKSTFPTAFITLYYGSRK